MITYTYLPKLTLSLLILFLAGSLPVVSQQNIEVKLSQALMSKGMQTCYTVDIPQADLKTVQQQWIKKLQEDNKSKVKESGQELVMAGAVKSEVTPDSLNIYSIIIQKDTIICLNVFLEVDSVFFSPKDDKTDLATDKVDNSIKNYMRGFAVEQYRNAVEDELEAEEKILKTLESDLDKLEKEEENLKKDNSSRENDIEEKEREIAETDKKIELKNQEINNHSTSILSLSTDIEKDAAKEKQKTLEKEKKELDKTRSRAKDDISSYKSDIEKNNKAIEECQTAQEEKKEEIVLQQNVIIAVELKLGGIK